MGDGPAAPAALLPSDGSPILLPRDDRLDAPCAADASSLGLERVVLAALSVLFLARSPFGEAARRARGGSAGPPRAAADRRSE